MNEKVNLSDIAKEISMNVGFGKKSTVEPILKNLVDIVRAHVKNGHTVSLMNLCTISPKENKSSEKYNTHTHEKYMSKPSKGVNIKPAYSWKEYLND